MSLVGLVFGALLITYLFGRLMRWLLRSMGDTPQRIFTANALAYAIAIPFADYGLADGGPPKFLLAFEYYTAAQLVWLAVDLVALKGRRAKSPNSN